MRARVCVCVCVCVCGGNTIDSDTMHKEDDKLLRWAVNDENCSPVFPLLQLQQRSELIHNQVAVLHNEYTETRDMWYRTQTHANVSSYSIIVRQSTSVYARVHGYIRVPQDNGCAIPRTGIQSSRRMTPK